MSETLIITQEHKEDGKTYDVVFVEVERVPRTEEDSMKVILESQGLDQTQIEDAIVDMKAQGLL